jgi:CelD/BcsL family acetyltransferase involved in cellulose biosynthesis
VFADKLAVPVHRINPLEDPRWTTFIERHPRASVFHSAEWLDALRRTYGYEPIGVTTTAPGEDLTNAIVFCSVRSWLTGSRLVSLPFSDHCQPLVRSHEELRHLLANLEQGENGRTWNYVEIRPVDRPGQGEMYLQAAESFSLHRLDLGPSQEELLRGFHKDCVQRKIRRAEREGLLYEEGRSERLLQQFYHLLVLTRRRHGLPPPPLTWFRNLTAGMGDRLKIRLASKDGYPVASILTLRYNSTLMYKYGGSDKQFSSLGGMQLLLWKAISEAKRDGLLEFDLGRSDLGNQGLIDFKDRWGAARFELTYLRSPGRRSRLRFGGVVMRIAKHIVSRAPERLVATAGKALYRHLG